MTILTGKVHPDKASILTRLYDEKTNKLPPAILKTYLVKDTKKDVWKIITIWKDKKSLEKMRKKGTPAGILMFREAGCQPSLSVHTVNRESLK